MSSGLPSPMRVRLASVKCLVSFLFSCAMKVRLIFVSSASPSAFLRATSARSLPPIRASAQRREHLKTCSIFKADGAKAAHSNRQAHAREPKAARERASAPKTVSCLPAHEFLQSSGGFCQAIFSPSFSGVVWPVEILHQSTPKVRARATSAGFFFPAGACGPKCSRHFLTPR